MSTSVSPITMNSCRAPAITDRSSPLKADGLRPRLSIARPTSVNASSGGWYRSIGYLSTLFGKGVEVVVVRDPRRSAFCWARNSANFSSGLTFERGEKML